MKGCVPSHMRKRLLAIIIVSLLTLPYASAFESSQVALVDHGALGDTDLGLTAAELSPDGTSVLLVGSEGYARLLSASHADDRANDVELLTGRTSTVNDVAWHPRGNTAFLIGDTGLAMRYDTVDHSVTNVNDSFRVMGLDLTTVDWRPSGDFAYVAGIDGSIWRFAEHTGFLQLENTGTSEISDITCHRNYNVCFAATLTDGVAVIDQGHNVTWLSGTLSETWVGIDCADPTLNECVAFASGLRSKNLRINTMDASQSSASELPNAFDVPGSEQIAVTQGSKGTSLVHLAPFGLLRHYPVTNQAFSVLNAEDAAEWDAAIAGRSMAAIWETGHLEGFIITEFGNVISFSQLLEEVDSSIMTVLVLAAVTVSVPGVIIGLTYMNSPWLQRKYKEWRFGSKRK